MKDDRVIGCDFDATLHPYTDGWVGYEPTDEPPIDGAPEFLAELHRLGYRVVVFSCRADHPLGVHGIWKWLGDWDLARFVDDVTEIKPHAEAYVDDRGVNFDGDWQKVLDNIATIVARPSRTTSWS